MTQIVDGRKIADEILSDLKKRVAKLKKQNINPALAVVLVGNDKPSQTYVKKKGESAEKVGITFFKSQFPDSISKDELISQINKIQTENKLSGLIIQLPLPKKLRPHTREIVNQINQEIDVDCLTYESLGQVMMGVSQIIPPTPGAIMEVLKFHKVDLEGKEICLVGRGDLIGKPLASMLQNEPVTLTTCNRSTIDLRSHTKKADIVIAGVGKKDLVMGDMVKEGVIVVDAGVCFDQGKMYGDINFESIKEKASIVTPTPGGVGPITVAKLLENTVKVAENR